MKINKVKLYAILTLLIVLLTPTIVKAEDLSTTQGAWAAVDADGTIVNIVVCSEAVCGSNGTLQGKVAYCETCTYVYQLPALDTGNVTGYTNGTFSASDNTFYTPNVKIVNNVVVNYPNCDSLTNVTNDTKCTHTKTISYVPENSVTPTSEQVTEVITFGKYKTFSKIIGKIEVKKKKTKKKVTTIKKKRKVISWSLQSKLKNAYLN